MGLQPGDVIEGREHHGDNWSETRLRLLWLGKQQAVWRVARRTNLAPKWHDVGEQSDWTLELRDWRLVSSADAPCALAPA